LHRIGLTKMRSKMKPIWRKIVLQAIVVGLILTLSACADVMKDFLCRPDGHCVNAPDRNTNYGAQG